MRYLLIDKIYMYKSNNSYPQGITLLEVIIVLAILALAYYVVLPRFNLHSGVEEVNKLNQIILDIRNASDLALLSKRTYRMVFYFSSGEYWLETIDQEYGVLSLEKLDKDPTEEEEILAIEEFDEKFQSYEKLAGEEIKDPQSDELIKPVSPVVEAKDKLRPPRWSKVNDLEWGIKSIGPFLIFESIQAEHHRRVQKFEEMQPNDRAMIYFFPSGYIESSVIHINYKDSYKSNTSSDGMTIKTLPYEGKAEIIKGYEELS